jgi:hypothetical protein
LIIILLAACTEDPEPNRLSKEDLYGTWVYQNVSTYTELELLASDTWEESQSKTPGDTSAIGGGIWSLQDSTMTVTYIGTFRIERIVQIVELDEQKLIWKLNGNTTTLLAK